MAKKYVTIGSLVNTHVYDDAVHTYGLDTDGAARVGTAPAVGDDVVRLDDLDTLVVGPAVSTDEAIARFDGITGKLLQNSTLFLDNNGNLYKLVDDLNIDCGANKTIELAQIVWDDVRIGIGSFDRPGISDPAIIAYQPTGAGLSIYLYEFALNDIASFVVQLPHKYKEGEDIYVHAHWTPGPNGVAESGNFVGWKVDYSWANVDGTFSAVSTADLSDVCDGTDDKHQMTPEVLIDGTGKTISSMLICNIRRTDTGADDTWAGTGAGNLPILLEVDFHFPIDTIGSRQIGTK